MTAHSIPQRGDAAPHFTEAHATHKIQSGLAVQLRFNARFARTDEKRDAGEDEHPLPPLAPPVTPYGCPKPYHDGFVFCALGVFALVPTKSLSADRYA